MNKAEIESAELLLDIGVSVAVRPLKFLKARIPLRRVVLRRPHLGGIIAIGRYYNRIGVTAEEMKGYNRDQWMAFIGEHGKEVSLIIACCLCTGCLNYHLFRWAAAWWVRWRIHPDSIAELMQLAVQQVNTAPFLIITELVEAINPLTPRTGH